eukprot:scaffold360_cov374-Pavlova_lutheri.AAC.69
MRAPYPSSSNLWTKHVNGMLHDAFYYSIFHPLQSASSTLRRDYESAHESSAPHDARQQFLDYKFGSTSCLPSCFHGQRRQSLQLLHRKSSAIAQSGSLSQKNTPLGQSYDVGICDWFLQDRESIPALRIDIHHTQAKSVVSYKLVLSSFIFRIHHEKELNRKQTKRLHKILTSHPLIREATQSFRDNLSQHSIRDEVRENTTWKHPS